MPALLLIQPWAYDLLTLGVRKSAANDAPDAAPQAGKKDYPTPPPGSKWITIHAHGDKNEPGHPVLITPTGDGNWKVIAGAGGSLNHLVLRNFDPNAPTPKKTPEKGNVGMQRFRKEQKQLAREDFVHSVAKHLGWTEEQTTFPEQSLRDKGVSEEAIKALRREHFRKLYSKALEAEQNAQAVLRHYLEAGENPLDPTTEVQASGIQHVKELVQQHLDAANKVRAELAALQSQTDFSKSTLEPLKSAFDDAEKLAKDADSKAQQAEEKATQLRAEAERIKHAGVKPEEETKAELAAQTAEEEARNLRAEAERHQMFGAQQRTNLEKANSAQEMAQVFRTTLQQQLAYHESQAKQLQTKLGDIQREPEHVAGGLGYARETTAEARRNIKNDIFSGDPTQALNGFVSDARSQAKATENTEAGRAAAVIYNSAADKYQDALSRHQAGDVDGAVESVLQAQILLARADQVESGGAATSIEAAKEREAHREKLEKLTQQIKDSGLYKNPDLYDKVVSVENARALVIAGEQLKQANKEIGRIQSLHEMKRGKSKRERAFEANFQAPSEAEVRRAVREAHNDLRQQLATFHAISLIQRADDNPDLSAKLHIDATNLPNVLKKHYQAGAFGAMASVSHILLNAGVLDKDVLDTFSTAGSAQILARVLKERLSGEDYSQALTALKDYHANTNGDIAKAAADEYDELMKSFDELHPEEAETAGDAFTAKILRDKQRYILSQALTTLGNAKGRLEMTAALIYAMEHPGNPDSLITMHMPTSVDADTLVKQLAALNLSPGEYDIRSAGDGYDVALHEYHPVLSQNKTNPEIIDTIARIRRGEMDAENWTPLGFKKVDTTPLDEETQRLETARTTPMEKLTDDSEAAHTLRDYFWQKMAKHEDFEGDMQTNPAMQAWRAFVAKQGSATEAYKVVQAELKPARQQPSVVMSGPFVKQQRAIKMIMARKRMLMALGPGSGKTLISLGAFSQLKQQGKVRRAIFLGPSINIGDFSTDMRDAMETPDTYHWYNQGEKGVDTSRSARAAALKNPKNDFVVYTHQAMRDDVVRLAAQQMGLTPEKAADAFSDSKMTREQRLDIVKKALASNGIDFNMLVVDEGHVALNRSGKENSIMANVIDALSDIAEYYMPMTGTPLKNDLSEIHDWLTKLDSDNYPPTSRKEFLRRYGVDTSAAKDALQREVQSYFFQDRITPIGPSNKPLQEIGTHTWHSADLLPKQRDAYQGVLHDYETAAGAAKTGRWDEEAMAAMQRLYPQHSPEAIKAHLDSLSKALGTAKSAALRHVIDDTPLEENAKTPQLMSVIKERLDTNHEPGIVFAGTDTAVHNIASYLESKGYRVATLTGKDSSSAKVEKKDLFHPQSASKSQHRQYVDAPAQAEGTKADIIIMSNAGEAGANLQRGKWVVQWDVPLTAKTQQQRDARAFRMKQTRDVRVYHLTTNSPEGIRAARRVDTKAALGEPFQSSSDQLDSHPFMAQLVSGRAHRLAGVPYKGDRYVPK